MDRRGIPERRYEVLNGLEVGVLRRRGFNRLAGPVAVYGSDEASLDHFCRE